MKLKFPFNKASIDVFVEDSDSDRRGLRKRRKKRGNNGPDTETPKMVSEKPDIAGTEAVPIVDLQIEKTDAADNEAAGDAHVEDVPLNQPVLMVETENVVHNTFRQTEEIKVKFFIVCDKYS